MSLIAAVEGVLEGKGPDHALLRVGGVTLRLSLPGYDLAELGASGSTVRLHTHLVVKEDDLQLYGFATEAGRQLFQALLDVNGVGPKVALALLSALRVESVAAAIVAGDAPTLSRAQGVGKRTAERIVLELRGKLEDELGFAMVPATGASFDGQDQALQALIALGYTAGEAQQALSVEREEGLGVEDRVRRALQRIGE